MPDRIRILLLGPPAVYKGDNLLNISRREVRTLLYYLACRTSPSSRGDLILLLWPDFPEELARKRLRETLARLRSALPDPDALLTLEEQVYLDPDRFSCDVLEFFSLAEETNRLLSQIPPSTPLPEPVYRKLLRATGLWRSARFLAGARLPDVEGIESWLVHTAQQLEVTYQRMLERLADHNTAAGSIDDAVIWLQKALEVNPLNDALHYRMVSLLDRQDRRSEALAYCQQVRDLYIREGMQDLPANLQAFYRELRDGISQAKIEGRARWVERRTIHVPLYGRSRELEKLRAAYHRGAPALVLGEAGSGKSRLVQELVKTLEPAPHLLVAAARPAEGGLPFQPLVDMLRHHVTAEEWKSMPAGWLATLALLLPELFVIFPDLNRPQTPAALAQTTLFEALHQALLRLTRSQRVLVFLDDAQWCDETSLTALAYLLNQGFFGERGALILAYRLEEENPVLQQVIDHLPDSAAVVKIPLSPLETQDVADIARHVLGRDLDEGFISQIRQDTGGNPLFLLETLRAMLEYSFDLDALPAAGRRLPLASSIHSIVRERLRHLSPDTRQVLITAAAIGRDFGLDVLESASHVDIEVIAQALEELERVHLVHANPEPHPAGVYSFIHDMIREVVLLDLSPARKRMVHLRVARALEEQGAGQPGEAGRMAYHYEEANELAPALEYWIKAAQHARQLYSTSEAAAAFQRAERILQQPSARASDDVVYQLYASWGEMAYDATDLESTRHAYSAMLQEGRRRQSPFLTGSAYSGLAQAADLQHDVAEGVKNLKMALPLLESFEDAFEKVQGYNRLGSFQFMSGQFGESIASYEKALSFIGETGSPRLITARAITYHRLASNYLTTGWPEKALAFTNLSFDDCLAMMDHANAMRAMATRAVASFHLGDYAFAEEQSNTALRMAAVMDNHRFEGYLLNNLSQIALAQGHIDQSWEFAARALAAGRAQGFPWVESEAHGMRGDIFLVTGAFELAIQEYRQGAASPVPGFHVLDNLCQLGLAMTFTGDCAAGIETIDGALQLSRPPGAGLVFVPALASRAYALCLAGRAPEALDQAGEAIALAEERKMANTLCHARSTLALAQLLTRLPARAYTTALAAVEHARQLANLPLEWINLQIALRAAREAGEDPAPLEIRLLNLIAGLQTSTRTPELQIDFQTLSARIAELLGF